MLRRSGRARHRRQPTRLLGALGCAAMVAAAPACNESERVDLGFRPPEGERVSYSVAVDSEVLTELDGPPSLASERIALRAEQVVVGRDDSGTLDLQIVMHRRDEHPRTFDVRLDPSRGVATVDSVEGLPVEVLGELGPSRLVLLAAGLLPDRTLRPGDEWTIDRTLELTEGTERITGTGRLVGLRRDGGTALARVEARTRLPVERELRTPQGRVDVTGVERTVAVVDYVVDDGTVARATSVTTGTFELVVSPPGGSRAAPLSGRLQVRVESRTTRT